jgi:hypothetical protein
MTLPPSWFPGEALFLRLWESVERLFTGLATPAQIRREGRARADVRRYEMLSDAQTQRELGDVMAGRLMLDRTGKLISPPTSASHEPERREPQLIRPGYDETLFNIAHRHEQVEAVHRLLNLRRTVVLAEEEIEQSAKNASSLNEEPVRPIDPDWLYRWKERAERISIEEMQRLWAKILVGETLGPGSFSLRTLETLFLVNKTEANLIAEMAVFCIKGYGKEMIIYKNRDYLAEKGLTFSKLLTLEDIGILAGVQSGSLFYQYAFENRGDHKFVPLAYNGKTLVVNEGGGNTLTVPAYLITISGIELLQLGKFEFADDYLLACARDIKKQQNLNVLIGDVGALSNFLSV